METESTKNYIMPFKIQEYKKRKSFRSFLSILVRLKTKKWYKSMQPQTV